MVDLHNRYNNAEEMHVKSVLRRVLEDIASDEVDDFKFIDNAKE